MLATNSNTILDITNLSCGYGGKPIIKDFNLKVNAGEVIAITGPNGCGKSTLLKAIYQLCLINNGTIFYNGKSLLGKTPESIKNMGIAYFMQKNAIFSELSVNENLILSLNGKSKQHKKVKIDEILSNFPDVGLWLQKSAGLLSGGQRRQLAMAMLFAQEADLWLLDEPTAGLDSEKSDLFILKIQESLRKTKGNPKTIIFIEHKSDIIKKLTKKIINLNSKKYESNY